MSVTTNEGLLAWVGGMESLCRPDSVRWCDGSETEYGEMCDLLVKSGTFVPVPKRPGSFLARSNPADVVCMIAKGG